MKEKKMNEEFGVRWSEEFGVRWSEFSRDGRLINKEKIFKTEKSLEKFLEKVETKDNFNAFEAWLN